MAKIPKKSLKEGDNTFIKKGVISIKRKEEIEKHPQSDVYFRFIRTGPASYMWFVKSSY